jgi:hypothetical protein
MTFDNRTFTYAGTSADFTGGYKVRFANDPVNRKDVLEREGHTNIVLVPLPAPMTKVQAVEYLKTVQPEGINLVALKCKEQYLTKCINIVSNPPRKRGRPMLPRDPNTNEIIRN